MIEKTLQFDDATIELLETVEVTQVGNEWHGVITTGQLSRDNYVKLNKALEVLGGKWNRGKKAHVFAARPEIESLKEQGEMVQEVYGWFATPEPVAQMVAEMVFADRGAFDYDVKILEPSAGEGHLLDSLLYYCFEPRLTLVELHPQRADLLRAKYPKANVITGDWMEVGAGEHFEVIIMNPPFEKKQDAQHVLKAYKCLKEGGVLVAIMSAGVKFREDKEYEQVREMAAEIVELPEGAFKESGTMINAVIVRIEK